MDMVAFMLDFTLFPEYFDKMDEDNKKRTLKNVKIIQEKTYNGAQNSGLSLNKQCFIDYIRATSRWFTAYSVPNEKIGGTYFRYYDVRLEDFLGMLDNPTL